MPPRETVAIKETAMSRTARPDPRSGPRRRRRLLIAGDAALALVLAAGAVALATAAPSEAESGPGGRDHRCPAADAAAGVPAVAPALGAGRGGRGHAGRGDRRRGHGLSGWRRRWRCTRWPRTARGGRRPGRASPPGPSWPGRLCATAAVRAASSPWSRSAWPRWSAWVSRRSGGCPAPTSVSCGPAPPAAAASRNWRPGGRSPKSRPGSGVSFTTSSPTPSA